jgi:hypothetical protein
MNNNDNNIVSDKIRQKVCSIANTMPGIFGNIYEENIDENFILSFLDTISNNQQQKQSSNPNIIVEFTKEQGIICICISLYGCKLILFIYTRY